MLFELFHCFTPFKGLTQDQFDEKARSQNIRFKFGLNESIKTLMLKLLKFKSNERPSARDILNEDLLSGFSKKENSSEKTKTEKCVNDENPVDNHQQNSSNNSPQKKQRLQHDSAECEISHSCCEISYKINPKVGCFDSKTEYQKVCPLVFSEMHHQISHKRVSSDVVPIAQHPSYSFRKDLNRCKDGSFTFITNTGKNNPLFQKDMRGICSRKNLPKEKKEDLTGTSSSENLISDNEKSHSESFKNIVLQSSIIPTVFLKYLPRFFETKIIKKTHVFCKKFGSSLQCLNKRVFMNFKKNDTVSTENNSCSKVTFSMNQSLKNQQLQNSLIFTCCQNQEIDTHSHSQKIKKHHSVQRQSTEFVKFKHNSCNNIPSIHFHAARHQFFSEVEIQDILENNKNKQKVQKNDEKIDLRKIAKLQKSETAKKQYLRRSLSLPFKMHSKIINIDNCQCVDHSQENDQRTSFLSKLN